MTVTGAAPLPEARTLTRSPTEKSTALPTASPAASGRRPADRVVGVPSVGSLLPTMAASVSGPWLTRTVNVPWPIRAVAPTPAVPLTACSSGGAMTLPWSVRWPSTL